MGEHVFHIGLDNDCGEIKSREPIKLAPKAEPVGYESPNGVTKTFSLQDELILQPLHRVVARPERGPLHDEPRRVQRPFFLFAGID